MTPTPLRVLVAGGGVAALEAVLALRALAGDHVAVEVLSPADDLVERPLSVLTPFSGVPAPHVSLAALDLRRHRGALAAVDVAEQVVRTTDGGELSYDRLLVAPGARRVEGVRGAVTFRGTISAGAVEGALRAARRRVLFVAPPGCGWTLPIYELALLATRELDGGVELAVASYEPRPLDVFGRAASDAVARLLLRAGVDFLSGATALDADAIIALPTLRGPGIEGLPVDADGFVEVDAHGRVPGAPGVFAAGDVTAGPIKQGGLATQQADAAAEQIAAEAGAPVIARPCRRVLRAVLLTGEAPLYLRRDLDDDTTVVRALRPGSRWSGSKVTGRYLTGFVAASLRVSREMTAPEPRRPEPSWHRD